MSYAVSRNAEGLYIITHPRHPGLAYSDEAGGWAPASIRLGQQRHRIITFESEAEADDYATENYLYPRVD